MATKAGKFPMKPQGNTTRIAKPSPSAVAPLPVNKAKIATVLKSQPRLAAQGNSKY